MGLNDLMGLNFEDSIKAIDEIRIYYLESGNSRGMLSAFHACHKHENGRYRDMIGIIRTFGNDYSLLGTEIRIETEEKTRKRMRKNYRKVALRAETAYYDFDGALDSPYDEEKVEFHESTSLENNGKVYFKTLIEKLILPDYKYCELLTVRKKENNWEHQI